MMGLHVVIADIVQTLKESPAAYPNEKAISQGIVLRILGQLGWSIHRTQEVWPEYSQGGGRVDYALCRVNDGKPLPLVFIEVKYLGKITEASEEQLFKYAVHQGVPLLVLTDGRLWRFYWIQALGSFEDRLIKEVDITESIREELIDLFTNLLHKDRYSSMNSLRSHLEALHKENKMERTLREVWEKFISLKDERLLNLLAQAVAERMEIEEAEVNRDLLSSFIREQTRKGDTFPKLYGGQRSEGRHTNQSTEDTAAVRKGLYFRGKFYPVKTVRELLKKAFQMVGEGIPNFLYDFEKSSENRGRSRRYLSRDPYQLYGEPFRRNNPNWQSEYCTSFRDSRGQEWWIAVNSSVDEAIRRIELIAKVANLPWQEGGLIVIWEKK